MHRHSPLSTAPTRCAVYTRKSVDERADSVLSSITTQRELCCSYIASQAGEGWVVINERFDDVGYSGATIVRPGLTRLLEAVSAGEVDAVIVYKIDRLSRSLRDFLNLAARLEALGVTFVSVTQSFNTTSSTGRLLLNILLSFAQFERDLIGERARDWKAGARSRGLWASGPAPFGYRTDRLRLVVDPEAAAVVRRVYREFPTARSYREIAARLNADGFTNRNGGSFSGGQIKLILTNRVYVGDLTYKGVPIAGDHEPIVTEREWAKAQRAVEKRDASPIVVAAKAWSARRYRGPKA